MACASAPQLAQTKGNATNCACCIVGTPNDASAWVMGSCNPARSVVTMSENISLAGKQTCTTCQEMDVHVPKACVSKVHHVVSGQAQCTAPEMAPVLYREGRGH